MSKPNHQPPHRSLIVDDFDTDEVASFEDEVTQEVEVLTTSQLLRLRDLQHLAG